MATRTDRDAFCQYKVHMAMLGLGIFTVPQLAKYSGVQMATVSSILGRLRNAERPLSLEEVGVELTQRRGGQLKRFQLTPPGRQFIRSRIAALRDALAAQDALPASSVASESAESVPPNIAAVEDILTRQVHAAEAEHEKLELLKEVDALLRNARADITELSVARTPGGHSPLSLWAGKIRMLQSTAALIRARFSLPRAFAVCIAEDRKADSTRKLAEHIATLIGDKELPQFQAYIRNLSALVSGAEGLEVHNRPRTPSRHIWGRGRVASTFSPGPSRFTRRNQFDIWDDGGVLIAYDSDVMASDASALTAKLSSLVGKAASERICIVFDTSHSPQIRNSMISMGVGYVDNARTLDHRALRAILEERQERVSWGRVCRAFFDPALGGRSSDQTLRPIIDARS